MIPSLNEGVHDAAKTLYLDWKRRYDEARKGLAASDPTPGDLAHAPKINLICDCCLRAFDCYRADYFHLRGEIPHYDRVPAIQTTPPTWVEAGGSKYWACSPECARILFLIHHQYAMRESRSDQA